MECTLWSRVPPTLASCSLIQRQLRSALRSAAISLAAAEVAILEGDGMEWVERLSCDLGILLDLTNDTQPSYKLQIMTDSLSRMCLVTGYWVSRHCRRVWWEGFWFHADPGTSDLLGCESEITIYSHRAAFPDHGETNQSALLPMEDVATCIR